MPNIQVKFLIAVEATVNGPRTDRDVSFSMVSMRLPNGVNILPLFAAQQADVDNVMNCIADAILDQSIPDRTDD